MENLSSPADYNDLKLKLAAFFDGGNHFVLATYYLTGDGSLVFSCYERLATVSNAVAVAAYLIVDGVGRRQAVGNLPVYNQLVAKVKACINPGLQFFRESLAKNFMRAFMPSLVPDSAVQYKSSNLAPQQLPWRS